MSATFTTLFERSRYSGCGRRFGLDEEARKEHMDQQERFAVGMIGFVLDHDSNFKQHFLEKIWGFNDLPQPADWEVQVEPENWGDLVLTHGFSNSLLVVEFKIGAELEPHQNPSCSEF